MKKTVVEGCSCCDNEICIEWDTNLFGYKAFCPVCGERLMLCSECQNDNIVCDWDSKKGSCCRTVEYTHRGLMSMFRIKAQKWQKMPDAKNEKELLETVRELIEFEMKNL